MNRRQMMMLSLPLIAAPATLMAQATAPAAPPKAAPAKAPAAPPRAKAAYDPAPTEVPIRDGFEVGSIVVVSGDYYLYHVIAPGRAIRYGVAVGTDELVWKGRALVGRKVEWPSWTPTKAMIERKPEQYKKYENGMPGGPENPLGARALYLHTVNGNDTSIRIHGTTDPGSIGRAVSNGCIRMRNEAVMDLFDKVPIGAPVYVY